MEPAVKILNATINESATGQPFHLVTHSLWEVITIATLSAIVSLITVVGNVLVMLSFKVNSQLKTVNNYYLLSLAAADLIIGVFSMNLYTSYILMGYWALGNLACDLWLALDYVASNASVMNLLVISFDRYFSITRPLTYRAKRTPKRAGVMIGLAWTVSLVLWAPPILCWQYFVGKRTVPEMQCQIQFFSEPVITFGTAIAAFYVPVSVMTILYCRIYKETEKRTKDLAELQGIHYSADPALAQPQKAIIRSCFSCKRSSKTQDRNQASWSSSSRSNAARAAAAAATNNDDEWSKADQLTTFNSYASSEDEERPVSPVAFQPDFQDQAAHGGGARRSVACSETERMSGGRGEEDSFFGTPPKSNPQKSKKCVSYKFKPAVKDAGGQQQQHGKNGDSKMFSSAESIAAPSTSAAAAKPMDATLKSQITKRKRMVLIKERKAAQTLSAILLAFILTWTPYNIMVLISTFCSDCIPVPLWHLGYWLCYVNSTVNPMCYALCNKTFQKTFRMLLQCSSPAKGSAAHPLPLQLVLPALSGVHQLQRLRGLHHHPGVLAQVLLVAVLLPVDDVPAVEVGAGAGVVPPAPPRHALKLQLGAVLEVVVVVPVLGGEPLVVVQVVLRVLREGVQRRAPVQPQPQPEARRLVLDQERVVLPGFGDAVFVHQVDPQRVAPGPPGQVVEVLVPQPVVPRQGAEALPVLGPGAVEAHAAVDGDVLHHGPAALLHGAGRQDGEPPRLDQVDAVSGLAR